MRSEFTPADWYWRADDDRVYASRAGAVIATGDPGLVAFLEAGGTPTVWPRDAAGQQTDAALGAVLAFYGVGPDLAPDLTAYAAAARYRAEVAGVATPQGRVATDDRSKVMILGAVLAAQIDPKWTTVWQFADGASATVDAAGIASIAAVVQAHVSRVFAVYADVMAGIAARPSSITTTAAIDAAFSVAA